MSAPAALLIAKIMIPDEEVATATKPSDVKIEIESHNVMDGAARGASEGVMLALNIGAVLIAFVSIVYLVNHGCSWAFNMSFTEMMGWVFRPFAWVSGIPVADVAAVGELLGTKTVVNEFVAYATMSEMIEAGQLSARSVTIATYALCGFANFSSIGIQLGGISAVAPRRRSALAKLGLKAMIGGAIASWLPATIAGIIY